MVLTPIIAEQLSVLLGEMVNAAAQSQGVAAKWWRAAADWYRGVLTVDRQLNGAVTYVAVAVFVLMLIGSPWADKLLSPRFDAKHFPVAAADFIATAKLSGNPYAHDQYGGYLIYRLAPQIKVFVDGRSDFYRQSAVLDDMDQISNTKPGCKDCLINMVSAGCCSGAMNRSR